MNAPYEKPSGIQVIDRLVRLLETLAKAKSPLPLRELAAQVALPPSTVHRILNAVVPSGLVERLEGGQYQLGLRLLELGAKVKERLTVRDVALPFLRQLHEATGESVNLGVRDGDEIVYIERASGGKSAVRVVHIVGSRAPLHTTATGKWFLAEMSAAERAAYCARTGLAPQTPRSLTTREALEKELAELTAQGVAFDLEEQEIGVRCIAAPIRDESGALVAGLSLSTPAERFDPAKAPLVQATAAAISRALGYRQAA
ncbi:IclR family transcriptional regulator [Hydrogenophilus islandicus]